MFSLQFLLNAPVVVAAPGTGVIHTLALGLGRGPRVALWAALGCTLGLVPHLAAATLGPAAMMHTSALLFTVLKFAGVAYLLYLAWQSLKEGRALTVQADTAQEPGWYVAQRNALINILNPKLSIFFLALLPPFLSSNAASATFEIILLGAIVTGMSFGVFVLYGCFAAAARHWLLDSKAMMRWLNRSFAAIFAALAGRPTLERA